MNRPEGSEVRQASRAVTAAAREAVAEEKVRIAWKGAMQPSVLELAAQATKERNAVGELGISRQVDTCTFPFQQVRLGDDGAEVESELCWKHCNPLPDRRTATVVTGKANTVGVCALSRRLMAMERARALGEKPMDLQSWALELEARRWREERAGRK